MRTFATKVGRSHTFVSRILGGLRLPPLEDLDGWLAAMAVDPAKRDTLHLAAHLAHCPTLVVEHLSKTQARLDEALAENARLRAVAESLQAAAEPGGAYAVGKSRTRNRAKPRRRL